MKHRALVAFVVAFAASAAVFYPQPGQAFWRYVGAHACHDSSPQPNATYKVQTEWGFSPGAGFLYMSPHPNGGTASCGLLNDTSLDRSQITSVKAYVVDHSVTDRVSVAACGQSPVGSSATCGLSAYSGSVVSFTGAATLTVTDLSAWGGGANVDTPFLRVHAPGHQSPAPFSGIRSYTWSD